MALPSIWYQQGNWHVLSVGLLCRLNLEGDSFSKIELATVLFTSRGLVACFAYRKERSRIHLYQVLFPVVAAAPNHSLKGKTRKAPFASILLLC